PTLFRSPAAGRLGRVLRGEEAELARRAAAVPPRGDEVAAGVELLDPVVARVDHVHVAGGVRGEAADRPELTVAAAVGAPLRLKHPFGGELLHHVAELVGHEHVPLRTDRDRLGEAQHALGALADDVRRDVWAGARAGARTGIGARAGNRGRRKGLCEKYRGRRPGAAAEGLDEPHLRGVNTRAPGRA